ncbi:MAG TPA: hypothetical protein VGK15_05840 [Candidatus Limnocylindria bacterium]|jgi:hypothetical protein
MVEQKHRSWRIRVPLAVAALALGLATTGGTALAGSGGEPNAAASCLGQEAAGISPAGSTDEFPGGVPEVISFLRTTFGAAGPVISVVAKLHEGSHEACDEATE